MIHPVLRDSAREPSFFITASSIGLQVEEEDPAGSPTSSFRNTGTNKTYSHAGLLLRRLCGHTSDDSNNIRQVERTLPFSFLPVKNYPNFTTQTTLASSYLYKSQELLSDHHPNSPHHGATTRDNCNLLLQCLQKIFLYASQTSFFYK